MALYANDLAGWVNKDNFHKKVVKKSSPLAMLAPAYLSDFPNPLILDLASSALPLLSQSTQVVTGLAS